MSDATRAGEPVCVCWGREGKPGLTGRQPDFKWSSFYRISLRSKMSPGIRGKKKK